MLKAAATDERLSLQLTCRRPRYANQLALLLVSLAGFLWASRVTQWREMESTAFEVGSSLWLPPNWYAVFACSTPDASSHRGYDYAFYLPLTALAWQRIGFNSIVQIIGSRSEWTGNPLLARVLRSLEETAATVLFIDAVTDHRTTLAQTARLFVTNMDAFPAGADDYLVTSDADLWPLNPDHYTPKWGAQLVLAHSLCCGFFKFNDSDYRMYPMSNIGATTRVWRQIMNDAHSPAKDANSIVNYLENYFGRRARISTLFASKNWFMDQHLVSIRIEHWMRSHGNASVHRVSDEGFSRFDRIDRVDWDRRIDLSQRKPSYFEHIFDAHLLEKPFYPENWTSLKQLLILMFGDRDWRIAWADEYAAAFYDVYKDLYLF